MRRTILLLVGFAIAGCGADAEAPIAAAPAAAPSFTPAAEPAPAPAKAARPTGRYLIAHLRRPTMLRRAPGGRAVAKIRTRTEFGSRTALSVVRRRGAWLQVVVTQRANGKLAWIPASRARLTGTDYALYVDRSARRLTLRRGRAILRQASIAVGRPTNPTPVGRFAVTDRLRPARADSPYGCCAIALTGHQTKLVPGWPGGDRLAIHGTPQPASIGQAVSLGCMRAHKRDLEYLIERVPLGTPVFVRA